MTVQAFAQTRALPIPATLLLPKRMASDTQDFDMRLAAALDAKTKPLGSLGDIERLAAKIARIQSTLRPSIETCRLTIFAGDHGMASAGVSAFPQAVTRQMVQNFLTGGAAANVFACTVGATVRVVDAGVAGEAVSHPELINRRIASGTQNAIAKPAMTSAQLQQAIAAGTDLGAGIEADVACFGEMGIGNTSASSLVAAKILNRPVSDLTGRGTGLDDSGMHRKHSLLEQAAIRTPDKLDTRTALMEYGGFEIAMMAGAMIGAAKTKRVIIVDGFIATVAALCARGTAPECEANFVFGHQSAEAGHALILEALNARPLLKLDMRLGEGTGALLAFPLVKAAAAMLRDMASFESANVSGPT